MAENMFEPFHDVVNNVSQAILKHQKERDRPIIGVMPAYFPLELIEAAGGYPVQLWGNNLPIEKADAYLQSYCCSVARSVMELEMRQISHMVSAYAFTSLCDTLINLREIYRMVFSKPTLELSIPITRTGVARHNYLKRVVESVITGLEKITGNKITPDSLSNAAEIYGRTRTLQRRLYRIRAKNPGLVKSLDFYSAIKTGFFLPGEIYNQLLEALLQRLEAKEALNGSGPKLLISGMVFDPLEIHRIIDELGARVVDDDFANGWRTVSKGNLNTGNLVKGITDYLFNPAPCCCIYNPDNDRHPYLLDRVKQSGADGVLLWYIKFCEPDAFDRPQLMKHLKEMNIPVSFIDLELTMTNFDAIRTRISAFCEILENP
jgi:bcr-type benzoyl-CoA reductase subunit C